jgi:molybdopterin-guanine dinucleotide biosynthesis protein A
VIACDIPLLDQQTIMQLIQERNPSKAATAFYNEETRFPDPLVTIWEPKAYPQLMHFLSLGYSCPRKVLINSDTEVLQPANANALLNANSPDEYEQVMKLLNS